jgi:hypothetical protein
MAEAIAFYTLAAFILGFAVLVITTKDTPRFWRRFRSWSTPAASSCCTCSW